MLVVGEPMLDAGQLHPSLPSFLNQGREEGANNASPDGLSILTSNFGTEYLFYHSLLLTKLGIN